LYCAFKHPELIKTLVLGEPPIVTLLERSNVKQTLNCSTHSERRLKSRLKKQAISQGDIEKGIRIFLDGVMGKQNFFDLIPAGARQLIMDNAETLRGDLHLTVGPLLSSSSSSSFGIEDFKQISAPTLLLRGEHTPKFLARITDILAENIPNTEQITIPGVTHDLGRMSKADIFNAKVIEFLELYT